MVLVYPTIIEFAFELNIKKREEIPLHRYNATFIYGTGISLFTFSCELLSERIKSISLNLPKHTYGKKLNMEREIVSC